MFIAALFTIAKLWKQPKRPSIDVYVYIHTHIQWNINHKNKNEVLPFATTWMDFEGITLNEISQTEKYKIPYDFTHRYR